MYSSREGRVYFYCSLSTSPDSKLEISNSPQFAKQFQSAIRVQHLNSNELILEFHLYNVNLNPCNPQIFSSNFTLQLLLTFQ